MRPITKGSIDQSVIVRVIDLVDGSPETGVAYNTAGVDLWYRREGGLEVSIVEAILATVDAAHADGGFIHVSDGYCRLDLPDAAVATGANGVMVGGTFTDMIVIGCYIPLVDYNPYDAVRMGMTALPNAAANAAGGLPISAAGGLALDTKLANANEITAARMATLTDWIDGGRLDLILDARASQTSITTAQNDLDILTGTDGVTLATAQALYAPAKVADLGTVQTANHTANIAAILDDTGTAGVVVATASKTGYALSAAGVQAIWDALTSALTTVGSIGKKLADWVVGTIDTYTGNTKQTADHTAGIADIPTVAEFNARSLPSADYVVVGDTLARVTLVDTVTTNTDLVTAAAVKTAMEAAGSDLDYLIKSLVNKLVITQANGNTEMFNDATVTLGSILAAFSSDGTYTTRKRMVI